MKIFPIDVAFIKKSNTIKHCISKTVLEHCLIVLNKKIKTKNLFDN